MKSSEKANKDKNTDTMEIEREGKSTNSNLSSSDSNGKAAKNNGSVEMENKVNLGLSKSNTKKGIPMLEKSLADLFTLKTKTLNYHWNVTGMNWNSLHALFETQYQELSAATDDMAERIRALGGVAPGSMREFLSLTRLKEANGEFKDARKMVENLLTDHEAVIQQLREDIETFEDELEDQGTTDFLTGLMIKHEETAWKLRAHIA